MKNRCMACKKEKLFAVLCVLALICLMIPFYWFGRYTAPLADDFNTVTGTYHAWITSHSIWQVILAAVEKTKGYYIGWTGAFTNVFLQCLMRDWEDYSHLFYCILDHIDYIFDCKFLFRQVPDRGCYGAGKNKMAHHYSDNNCDSDRMSASSI